MLLTAHMSLSAGTSIAGLGLAALAAYFAFRAVHWARQTVKDGDKASRAAADRHEEQIREMKAATDAAAEQHRVEMEDRQRVASAERRQSQLQQINVLMQMVGEAEIVARESLTTKGDGVVLGTHIPSLMLQIEGALTLLNALGVPSPEQAVDLTTTARVGSVPLSWVAAASVVCLLAFQELLLDVSVGKVGVVPNELAWRPLGPG